MADGPNSLRPPAAAEQQTPTSGQSARHPLVWSVAVAVFALALTVLCGLLTSGPTSRGDSEQRPADLAPEPRPAHEAPTAPQSPLTPDAIFAQCSPAVVQVVVQDHQGRSFADGSGFLVGTGGLIATNYHVIEGAHTAQVILADNTKYPVEGAAALDSDADLAIIKVTGRISARPLELAGDDLPPVGVRVYAIGNPLGLTHTLSDGLVSGHREKGTIPDFPYPKMPTLIQTTAPISPGSSGGPLLGSDGKVVGVTTLRNPRGQNLNLAVPSSCVAQLLARCHDGGLLARFPAGREPAAVQPKSADEWSPEEVGNAAHFARAMRTYREAWDLCREADRRPWQPGDPPEILNSAGQAPSKAKRPWLLKAADRREFVRLIEEASREAGMVRSDVLRRMHRQLPDALEDFIISTRYLASSVAAGRPPETRIYAAGRRWGEWWMTNRADVRIPEGAKR